jgi:hypothetical protein
MNETMDIIGGIDLYHRGKRYGNGTLFTLPFGRNVRFLDKNGLDSDLKQAHDWRMKKNDIFTVREIYVGGWNSEVEFVEIPDIRFNTVMFEDIDIKQKGE